MFAITSAPEALRAVLVCAQWGGIHRKRADKAKTNRKTNDKGLLRFVSFTDCLEPALRFVSSHFSVIYRASFPLFPMPLPSYSAGGRPLSLPHIFRALLCLLPGAFL